jgi:regulator of cell morphogenesis and NO signaling
MEINSNTIVGDIVRVNFKAAQIFEKNNIDFCCGGQISLLEACDKSKVDINSIMPELEAIVQVSDPDSKYLEGLDLDALCEYIVKRHHTYVSENIPFLKQKLQKLCDVHGENHPELFEVARLFGEGADNLTMHMQKEEIVLFPTIANMVKHKNDNNASSDFGCGVQAPISQMIYEHEAEGERFMKIAEITNNYTPPADGCNTYQITYKTLQEFEQDLHRHIHIENNILFKKAVVLEEELCVNKN